jgi:diguanylate cyclase (GGDEF)-like protein/PAS domain S-box-containing protein
MDRDALADIIVSLPDGVVVIDSSGGVLWANEAAARLLGPATANMVGTNVLDAVHVDDRELAAVALTGRPGPTVGSRLELRVGTGGEWTSVEVTTSHGVGDSVGDSHGMVLCLRHVTGRRRSESDPNETGRFRSLVHNAASILMILEPTGEIQCVSAAVTRLLGHEQERVEGQLLTDYVIERDRRLVESALARALGAPQWNSGPTVVEVEMVRCDDGATLPFELSIVNLVDDPTVGGFVVSAHDISQLRATQEALDGAGARDPLTDLPNRDALCRRLERCLDDPKTAVIFLDLDGFKDVNGQFGREAGDELLRLLGDRLRQSVRKSDFVARHGGDEFVVVARTENDGDLEKLSQRLVRAIEHPTELGGGSIRLSASAGLARPYPQDTPDTILARADTAMFTAKIHGDGLPHVMSN